MEQKYCDLTTNSPAEITCSSMMDKPWISGIPSKKQARYQPVTIYTYWPVLGSYNNWNIIGLTPKATPFEEFDDIHQVFLDVGYKYK